MGPDLNPALPYQGPQAIPYTSVQEALAHQGAEGQAAPPGTTAVQVEYGDTISGLLATEPYNLDWNNPEQRTQFLLDNPQFATPQDLRDHPELAQLAGERNPDQIWPGEVVYIRDPQPPEVVAEHHDGTQSVRNADGQVVRVDATGQPVNGAYWTGGDSRGNASYAVYKDGVQTEQSWMVAVDHSGYTNQPGQYPERPGQNPAPLGPHATNTVQGATNRAASDYYDQGHPQPFIDAVRAELDSGESTVQMIRDRYGNDPWMNAVIEEAAFGPQPQG